MKTRDGKVCWLQIRRLACTNHQCGTLHRELPDRLVPFKHFEVDIIAGVLDGVITPETKGYEDHPCESTMQQWHHWLRFNRATIDGTLKSIGYQVLGFTEALLSSGLSLLERLRKDTCDWLPIILRFIYHSGNSLASSWNR